MSYKKEVELLKNNIKEIYENAVKLGFDAKFKGTQDIVTTTDLAIEKAIVALIKEHYPQDRFHTEEFYSDTLLNDRTWIIDPIDGTSNYAVGMGLFVVQIALYDHADIALSFVYIPEFNQTYYAIKGQGACMNGIPYHIDDHQGLSNFMISMVGITQKDNDKTYYNQLVSFAQKYNYKLRMLGSIGLEMTLASFGIFDLFYSNVTNIWDIYPGICLAREAGALLLNELGQPYRLGIDEHLFICKNQQVKAEVFKHIK